MCIRDRRNPQTKNASGKSAHACRSSHGVRGARGVGCPIIRARASGEDGVRSLKLLRTTASSPRTWLLRASRSWY
eukprot:7196855-Alexandrium_andersonii.AAC.1